MRLFKRGDSPEDAPSQDRIWVRHKVWFAVGSVVVVAAVALGIWGLTGNSSSAATATSETETVAATTITQSVPATGTLASANEADMSFASAGQVTAVNVTAGQQVTKGQPLASITSATLSANVANAQVTLASAQNRLSTDTTAGASADQLTADQQSLTVAQNSVTDAQQALAGATMTAPFSGTIASVDLTVGEQVSGSSSSSSSSSGSGSGGGSGGSGSFGGGGSSSALSAASSTTSSSASTAQVVLIDPVHFTVSATVDDTAIGSVKTGLQATITANGSTTPVFGTVSSVGLIASSTSGVTTYPVTIAVTGAQPTLHPGASANVSIIVKQLTDVLAVPTAAIHYSGSTPKVTVVDGSRKIETTVTVGTASGLETQITKGLTAGDKIVVPVTRVGGTGGRTRTGTGGGFGGGGFGGGGFGGGGFGGGGFGGARTGLAG